MKTSSLVRQDSAFDIHGPQSVAASQKLPTSPAPKARAIGELDRRALVAPAPQVDSLAKPKAKPIGVTLSLTSTAVADRLSQQMTVLAQRHPGSLQRNAGLQLPQLGAELPLLTKIDQILMPVFESLPRRGPEALCAAQLLLSRDTMTDHFMARNYTEVTQQAEALTDLAGLPGMAPAVRTLRLELLLLARRRRAQTTHTTISPRASAQAALEALENSLVALVVRPT